MSLTTILADVVGQGPSPSVPAPEQPVSKSRDRLTGLPIPDKVKVPLALLGAVHLKDQDTLPVMPLVAFGILWVTFTEEKLSRIVVVPAKGADKVPPVAFIA